MFWSKVEELTGDSIPICVKKILTKCGFNSVFSVKNITPESVVQIEKHINLHGLDLIQTLDCCHHEYYKGQNVFKFLPGHKDVILSLPGFAVQMLHPDKYLIQVIEQYAGFSKILREILKTAIQNHKLPKNKAEYSDTIRYFATYIFLLCGRSCYEVLCKNLPLPSISSISE